MINRMIEAARSVLTSAEYESGPPAGDLAELTVGRAWLDDLLRAIAEVEGLAS